MIAAEKTLARADCPDAIAGHGYIGPAEQLRAVADRAAGSDKDVYGAGVTLNAFEAKIAALLGKESAVFMPTGTMAQQILLRIVADRRGTRAFAAHATNHVVLHERDGYTRLHGLPFVPAGSPTAPLALADLRALAEPVAALLLELPQRELGGILPAWDELVALAGAARARGWHLHMDGARLWECGPFYDRPYAEIAALFDTVYVSFYKGIGAIAGAMLAGPRDIVEEAKVWQRRHGGNLVTLFPYALSAEQSFDDRIGKMRAYHEAAVDVARELARYDAVRVNPQPPHANMFHAFVRGDATALDERVQRIARERGIWTISKLAPTTIPDVHRWEVAAGDATLALGSQRLREVLEALFGR